jgi:hypothetical protein
MWRGRIREERGTALVELALVLPLLLIVLLGMLDFGKAFNEWISQTHLASEGARLAAVNYCPSPSSDGLDVTGRRPDAAPTRTIISPGTSTANPR